ncbi:unnamed protein product [Clonostachys solani]|uniref:Nephrocystin 3-like N-terminal domain-containing protein n=1 Tax=Clonostachys solani TaxID=160281 RepID=A0A9P0EPU1_9HYPO|nr:unnamed protein product [Clonostachys solani]
MIGLASLMRFRKLRLLSEQTRINIILNRASSICGDSLTLRDTKMKSTRNRFRDDLQSWLLWIKGDPGKGKTMLLCGIIDELEKGTNSLLSYFFC